MSALPAPGGFRQEIAGCERAVLPSPWSPGVVAVFLLDAPDGPWLVDVGADSAESAGVLRRALDARLGVGSNPAGVILSHAHLDHAGGLEALRLPTAVAHEDAAAAYAADERTAADVRFRTLSGESGTLSGPAGWEWIRAGGHAPGHLLLWNPGTGAMLGGDQFLLGLKTPLRVADESEDSLGDYLQSLERVAALDPSVILTSHTEPIERPAAWLARESGRLSRQLDRTLEAVRRGARTPQEVMERTYGRLPGTGARELLLREKLAALRHLAAVGEVRKGREDGREVFET